jgi:hypothetical protein
MFVLWQSSPEGAIGASEGRLLAIRENAPFAEVGDHYNAMKQVVAPMGEGVIGCGRVPRFSNIAALLYHILQIAVPLRGNPIQMYTDKVCHSEKAIRKTVRNMSLLRR